MFNISPEKFSEIAENLDPVKPLNVIMLFHSNVEVQLTEQGSVSWPLYPTIVKLAAFSEPLSRSGS